MEAKFFDKDVTEPANYFGVMKEKTESVLYFYLKKESIADHPSKAEPFIFEGPATERQIREYPKQYEEYIRLKNPPKVDELLKADPEPYSEPKVDFEAPIEHEEKIEE